MRKNRHLLDWIVAQYHHFFVKSLRLNHMVVGDFVYRVENYCCIRNKRHLLSQRDITVVTNSF